MDKKLVGWSLCNSVRIKQSMHLRIKILLSFYRPPVIVGKSSLKTYKLNNQADIQIRIKKELMHKKLYNNIYY